MSELIWFAVIFFASLWGDQQLTQGHALADAAIGGGSGAVTGDAVGAGQDRAITLVLSSWDDRMHMAMDLVNVGAKHKGLKGRVYLANEKTMMDANGEVVVGVLDVTKTAKGKPVAEWRFSAADLKKVKRADDQGMGYDLFLPFPEGLPAITKVKILIAFIPEKGATVFGDATISTLQPEECAETSLKKMATPAASIAAAPSGKYLPHLPQYFPHSEPYPLPEELIIQEEAAKKDADNQQKSKQLIAQPVPVPQVQLDTIVVQINRSAVPDATYRWIEKQMGFPGDNPFGVLKNKSSAGELIGALNKDGLASILARPNIITLSGSRSSFQCGVGAVPGTGKPMAPTANTEINSLPVVLANGNIRLEVNSEITTIYPALGTAAQPGCKKRSITAVAELKPGQTLAISVKQEKDDVLILVTPHLVKPAEVAKADKPRALPPLAPAPLQIDKSAIVQASATEMRTTKPPVPKVTLQDIVQLSQHAGTEEIIIRQIELTNTVFQLTTNDLVYLLEHGVSTRVIRAMQDRREQTPLAPVPTLPHLPIVPTPISLDFGFPMGNVPMDRSGPFTFPIGASASPAPANRMNPLSCNDPLVRMEECDINEENLRLMHDEFRRFWMNDPPVQTTSNRAAPK